MKNLLIVITILSLFVSCSINPKDDYLNDFGVFINEIELNHEDYDDDEWVSIEDDYNDYSELQFLDFKNDLTSKELEVIDDYRDRFTKIRVQRHPVDNFLEIIGL